MSRCSIRVLPSLPSMRRAPPLAHEIAVVIDALRATTSMVAALAAGAQRIWPCLEVDEARAMRGRMPNALLAGERQGLPLPGFDLGNSPAEFNATRVAGRDLIFTTSNGTRAIIACASAQRVLLAAITNLQAVVQAIVKTIVNPMRVDLHVVIACAGANDCESLEDLLVAGAIVERLRLEVLARFDGQADTSAGVRMDFELDAEADRATGLWQTHGGSPAELLAVFQASPGGRHLQEIDMQADIPRSVEVDRYDVVPVLDLASGCITLLRE